MKKLRNLKRMLWTAFLNYFPGFVVLIFSMLALHLTIILVDGYEEYAQMHDNNAVVAGHDPDYHSHTHTHIHRSFNGPGNKLRQEGNQLYWSVVAVGLAGFILILLNIHKVIQLKRNDKDRQKTLRLLQERMTAIENSLDGVALVDSDGNLSYMNEALIRMHGLDHKKSRDIIGKSWRLLYGNQEQERLQNVVLPQIERKGRWRGEVNIPGEEGSGIINTELSLTRVPEGGIVMIVRDITSRKDAQREREELQRQINQAQKMEAIGRLAGGISHDFNNILAAMNGYAEFLIDDLDAESPQHGFAQNILLAGKQASGLVDQMLAFSRRNSTEVEVINVVSPLKDSIAMLQASLPKTVEVKAEVDDENISIHGNTTQIAQVIMNLCVNAKDAMENERGILEIGLREIEASDYDFLDILSHALPAVDSTPSTRLETVNEDRSRLILSTLAEGKRYVCLRVADNGSGMTRSTMEYIFEPFFTTKPVDKGTGLGLATVHGVIVSHQGAMVIDSTVGAGTEFLLFFPVLDEQAGQTDQSKTQQEDVPDDINILLVDDQKEVRDMTMMMLRRLGFEVEDTETAEEALAVLRENPGYFNLVITDQNMPKITGVEFVQMASNDFPDLPFIILSGYSRSKLQDLMKEHPSIKSVLRKPVSSQDLAQEIRSLVGARKSA